jgi:hypothetical protein
MGHKDPKEGGREWRTKTKTNKKQQKDRKAKREGVNDFTREYSNRQSNTENRYSLLSDEEGEVCWGGDGSN